MNLKFFNINLAHKLQAAASAQNHHFLISVQKISDVFYRSFFLSLHLSFVGHRKTFFDVFHNSEKREL